jgi:ribosomal protein L18
MRQKRVRRVVKGTALRPRLNVFRSARHMYAQIIDDATGQTLLALSTLSPAFKTALAEAEAKRAAAEAAAAAAAAAAAEKPAEEKAEGKGKKGKAAAKKESEPAKPAEPQAKIGQAKQVGRLIAQAAKEKGITKVVFDRNGFLYHGRIKAVAEGAREGGLEF